MTPFNSDRTPLQRLLWLGGMARAAGKEVEDTATGNPLSFVTDLAKPLSRLVANFLPVQSGTGDPSPENVRPITGLAGVTVGHSGANLFDGLMEYGNIDNNGSNTTPLNQNYYRSKGYVSAKPNQSYTFSGANTSGYDQFYTLEYDTDKNFIANTRIQQTKDNSITFTTTASTRYFRFFFYKSGGISEGLSTALMVNIGSTAETYEQYKSVETYPVTFPETVYGGFVDLVTGEVWAEWYELAKTWGDFIAKTSLGDNTRGVLSIASYPSKTVGQAADAKCNVAPQGTGWSTDTIHFYTNEGSCIVILPNDTDESTEIQVVYPLATPVLVATLTPSQITALVGNNTVWSDANGDCEVTFLKKG